MRNSDRATLLILLGSALLGAAIGLLLQHGFSGSGAPTLIPPLSLPATLVMLAAVLVIFGVRLRRNIVSKPGAVNAFHAVRLLATARAGQIVGALFGGVGVGLALAVLGRSVAPPVATWLPMVLTAGAGVVLAVCAVITERLCRVPPGDGDSASPGTDAASDSDPGTEPAYRR